MPVLQKLLRHMVADSVAAARDEDAAFLLKLHHALLCAFFPIVTALRRIVKFNPSLA
jgi:hypothetical protein